MELLAFLNGIEYREIKVIFSLPFRVSCETLKPKLASVMNHQTLITFVMGTMFLYKGGMYKQL
jgi:hypothetical protein